MPAPSASVDFVKIVSMFLWQSKHEEEWHDALDVEPLEAALNLFSWRYGIRLSFLSFILWVEDIFGNFLL